VMSFYRTSFNQSVSQIKSKTLALSLIWTMMKFHKRNKKFI